MTSLTQSTAVEVHPTVAVRPPESDDAASWAVYFESLYKEADSDATRVPWADGRANPAMTAWLNREAPGLVRPGASVIVVGCGLGDDVRDLSDRGYDVAAFDVSPTAVQWARSRHPALADRFVVADLFAPPPGLLRRADLVVEINTIQSLHPSMREGAAKAIAALSRPRGTILAICHGRSGSDELPDAPPYPLSKRELEALFGGCGWAPIREIDDFMDEEDPPKRRLRGAFRRS